MFNIKINLHLVLDASLEVAHEGDRLVVLKLSVLYWFSIEEIIQLDHEDGRSRFLIQRRFLTCGITDGGLKKKREGKTNGGNFILS